MKKTIILLLIIINSFCGLAQTTLTDSIQKLDEVTLSDVKLKKYNSGFKITTLNDSIINKSAMSLTSLLALNSNIYFKEFGFGMLSSPSFRGTNASQTAVIWNGININSQLNGQTDFNNEIASNYSSIIIRNGGGSVQYGSGAIGGSVHLNNTLKFNNHFENNLRLNYGSFETQNVNYLLSSGTSKWTTSVGFSYLDSKNDYKYLGTDRKNENGEFNSVNLSANLGYFISNSNILKFYHNSYVGNRNLSGTIASSSRDRYESDNFRSLVEWAFLSKNYNSKLKIAHLSETYRYFTNKDSNVSSFGNASSLIAKHDFEYNISKTFNLRSVLDYTFTKGKGSSFGSPLRKVFSATLILNHMIFRKFNYGFNIRKDYTNEFKSPLVISGDLKYDFLEWYTIKFNASKNFRMPTFNDLYWESGGNLNLKPETSYQGDFGQLFTLKPVTLAINIYYIKTTNMIQWRPNDLGFWSPVNINKAKSYGTELEFNVKHNFDSHYFNFKANYSYTVSKDIDSGKQLVYVPFHKGNTSVSYNYKRVTMFYQHNIIGGVFTTEENINSRFFSLDSYDVANLGFSYTFASSIDSSYSLGMNINNLFNKYYENVALRPMPNRNYQIQLTIKF